MKNNRNCTNAHTHYAHTHKQTNTHKYKNAHTQKEPCTKDRYVTYLAEVRLREVILDAVVEHEAHVRVEIVEILIRPSSNLPQN